MAVDWTNGGAKLSITYVNDAFTRIFGYTWEEAIDQSPTMLCGPSTDRDVLKKGLERVLCHGSGVFDVIHYRKDGKPIWLEFSVIPVRTQMEPLRAHCRLPANSRLSIGERTQRRSRDRTPGGTDRDMQAMSQTGPPQRHCACARRPSSSATRVPNPHPRTGNIVNSRYGEAIRSKRKMLTDVKSRAHDARRYESFSHRTFIDSTSFSPGCPRELHRLPARERPWPGAR